jgi:hypothetical protein
MSKAKTNTLILVTNTVAARQWRAELLKRTTLTEEEIGEYSGSVKQVKPVTIASYQILTAKRKGEYAHIALLNAKDWGLIVYDEVHLLPAPVFRMTAELQARRRLGLTATLVREVPGGRDELPSRALATAGGGPFATHPSDPDGLRTIGRVFQIDIALPPGTQADGFGMRAHLRFTHDWEPIGTQLWRRIRQLLLSHLQT